MNRVLYGVPTWAWLVAMGMHGGCSQSQQTKTHAPPVSCDARLLCDGGLASSAKDASLGSSTSDAGPSPDSGTLDAGMALPECPALQRCLMEADPDAAAPDGRAKAVCTASGDCEEAVAIGSPMHAEGPIDYPDPPPAGGEHNSCWGAWGVHATPLPAENWVHNLEHGGVVLLYNCADGCTNDVKLLQGFVAKHGLTLLTEYSQMPKRFAVVAWGYRLQSDTLDLDALLAFYTEHVDHGPESITSGPPVGCP